MKSTNLTHAKYVQIGSCDYREQQGRQDVQITFQKRKTARVRDRRGVGSERWGRSGPGYWRMGLGTTRRCTCWRKWAKRRGRRRNFWCSARTDRRWQQIKKVEPNSPIRTAEDAAQRIEERLIQQGRACQRWIPKNFL